MKKYELIKQYPGSDHVGVVVSQKTPNGMYEGWEYNYYKRHVENNPEYWEEVIEKDYEILSYVAKDNPTNITTKRRGAHLHEEYWTIHKIKRLSDGEVFTVGDKITGYHEDARSIQTIRICIYTGRIRLEQSGGYTDLMYATKAKQPIFLTYDGKDIFAGDTIWWVRKDSTSIIGRLIIPPGEKFNSDMTAYFLTREEAEEYIEKNKVLFITEDGVGIKKGYSYYFVDTDFKISLAPNATAGSGWYDEIKYFSTYETAQYYVIVNAKVLSIEEFWKFVSKPGSNIVKQKQLKRLVKERLNLK